MPELPDIEVYAAALRRKVSGHVLARVQLASPFVLRTAVPPIEEAVGQRVRAASRLGKRLVLSLETDDHLVVHLMRAGRLRWSDLPKKTAMRGTQVAFEFDNGVLSLTEAGTRRRASLHFLRGSAALAAMDPGGLEVLEVEASAFVARLRSENHTLKRALTDPALFSGIGGAYSDEILHRARLSPMALSQSLSDDEANRLFDAAQQALREWTATLLREADGGFPREVTAFREDMAVHGRYGKPCPVCGAPVQRIVYAETETNYCARCQTEGLVLADRSLSRLLKASFPRDLDEIG